VSACDSDARSTASETSRSVDGGPAGPRTPVKVLEGRLRAIRGALNGSSGRVCKRRVKDGSTALRRSGGGGSRDAEVAHAERARSCTYLAAATRPDSRRLEWAGPCSVSSTRRDHHHKAGARTPRGGFPRGAADRVERLIWTPADASDGAYGASLVPRMVPRGPTGDPAMAQQRRKPRHLRGFPCAEEDSNVHGPYSPQGPQLCPQSTGRRCIAYVSEVRASGRSGPMFSPVCSQGCAHATVAVGDLLPVRISEVIHAVRTGEEVVDVALD
jgi:hypothetical protein